MDNKGDSESLRPEDINTKEELGIGLRSLSSGRSLRNLAAASEGLPRGRSFATGTLSAIFSGKSMPNADTLDAYLIVCELPEDEKKRWITAWMRVKGAFGTILVTAEVDGVETAMSHRELIDTWLVRQKKDLLDSPSGPLNVMDEILGVVEGAFTMFADVTRLVNQLPEDPRGKTDPVAFGRFGVQAIELSLHRFMKIPQMRAAASKDRMVERNFPEEVETYLSECRQLLESRLLTRMARWQKCSLRLRVANPGETDILGVVVRLSFPEGVKPIDPALAYVPGEGLPPRPLPRNVSPSSGITLLDAYNQDFKLIRQLQDVFVERPESFDYTITGEDPPSVEVRALDLPAKESVILPSIPLMVGRPADTEFAVRWNATGSAVHERFSGHLSVPVVASTMPTDDLFPSTDRRSEDGCRLSGE
jgi:hypothetical protein